jgi:outer membrane cobalamin receptor
MVKEGAGIDRCGRWTMYYCFLSSLFLTVPMALFSHNHTITISGVVTDTEGNPVSFASIAIENSTIGTTTGERGHFQLKIEKSEVYNILIRSVGYKEKKVELEVNDKEEYSLEIFLEEVNLAIGEVTVRGSGSQERMRQTGYAIEVLETKKQKSFASNLENVIKQSSGVHIRETGGLGSGFKLSLNGLSGNQIRFFVDGIPMENAGSALTLNNYPVNLIEQIEVYKGVVPVSLGADALGGAINIVTQNRQNSFTDASYTFGSFNTHKVSVNTQVSGKGLFAKFSSFLNHSDNNYTMVDMPVYDVNGNNTGTQNIQRFHDTYTSGMASLEGGFLDKKAADEWSVKLTYGQNHKDYQNPDNNINRVFGDFSTQSKSLLFSSVYIKEFDSFSLKAYLMGGTVNEQVTDTSTFKYNWAGDAFKREPNDPKGELFERRSLFKMKDKLLRSQLNATYSISATSKFNLNFAHNYLNRTGKDEVDVLNQSFTSPNSISKIILGLSWNYFSKNEKLNASLFGKQYWYSGTIESFDIEGNRSFSNPGFSRMGFGAAVSWHISNALLVKSSFEKAFRTPESFEILGDGKYINPNPLLEPENSWNFNLGGRLNHWAGNTNIRSEINLFNRTSQDFIRFKPLGPFGEYENLNHVLTQGIEGGVSINHNQLIMLDANVTYQNLTDQTEFDEGLPNTNYKSRVPNIPYFFSNARLGVSPNKKKAVNQFAFYWNTRYVHEFFLTWENLGNPNQKYTIPGQLIHDFVADYSLKNGRYSVSFTISNLTNELAYDNFRIQKPGRAFYLKFNWFIQNKSDL